MAEGGRGGEVMIRLVRENDHVCVSFRLYKRQKVVYSLLNYLSVLSRSSRNVYLKHGWVKASSWDLHPMLYLPHDGRVPPLPSLRLVKDAWSTVEGF